eukprot:TRINITY_DN12360_c0_g1_i1.p1 TRINITY_DN12360_c0_g1~~TRINITY_DN12360_c0_g1_i1.p1  ORF type:complete len:400 (-),score=100.41 TRINITY_DN12360_c0_g1_i1:288-1487(-)
MALYRIPAADQECPSSPPSCCFPPWPPASPPARRRRSPARAAAAWRRRRPLPPPPLGGGAARPPDAILGVTQAFGRDASPRKSTSASAPTATMAANRTSSRRCGRPRRASRRGASTWSTSPWRATRASSARPWSWRTGRGRAGGPRVGANAVGDGACRLAGDLLARFAGKDGPGEGGRPLVLLPNPSWANHGAIFHDAGCTVGTYTYYEPSTKSLNLEGMLADLRAAPAGATVLLHACAHNPTGVDPDGDAWAAISAAVAEAGLHPLFDMAYQGFTSGDADADAAAVRRFVADGHAVVLAQSFSKNFGLYGHRVGALSVMAGDEAAAAAVTSQLCILGRPAYSNPPVHGVRLVDEVLGDAALAAQWRGRCGGWPTALRGCARRWWRRSPTRAAPRIGGM